MLKLGKLGNHFLMYVERWHTKMKKGEIKVVHDNDLTNLLKSLNVYDGIIAGEHKCFFCQSEITLDNLEVVFPHEGKVNFCCEKSKCYNALVSLKEKGKANA